MPDPKSGSDSRQRESPQAGEIGNVLDSILEDSLAETPQRREENRNLLRDFVSDALYQQQYSSQDIAFQIEARIQALDDLISVQINEVLHHPEYQNLESVWRGLSGLVEETTRDQSVVVQIYPAKPRELGRGHLEDLVITERLGTLGATPFSVLFGIYDFDAAGFVHLRHLGNLARRARTVFLGAASPSLLGLDSFSQISGSRPLTQSLELNDAWHNLVQDPVAEHLLLALPRVMMREPYSKDRSTPRYSHDERLDGRDRSKYLWGSPLWHIAAQLAHAYSAGSWCADLAVTAQTSISRGFASVWLQEEDGDVVRLGPLEASPDDSALYQLRSSGFTSLSCDTLSGRIVIEQPQLLDRSSETSGRGARTIHLLRDGIGRGRLEHYIISIARELRGQMAGPDEFERVINRWVETNFPSNSNALYLEPIANERFLVEGSVATANSHTPVRVSVPVRLYESQLPAEPGLPLDHDVPPPSPATNVAADLRPYFELLREVAELKQHGFIGSVDQESIKQSVLKNVHRRLGESPDLSTLPCPALAPLFPGAGSGKDPSRLQISFDSGEPAPAADYATLFDVLEGVHSLLCRSSFEIQSVHRASPGALIGVTFAQAAQALSQIFSFGNQLKELRLSSVKVQEARLELTRKEIELDDFKRQAEVKRSVSQLDEQIEAARKMVELEELRKKRDEAIRDRRKLIMDDVAQRFDLIGRALPILQSLPPDMQDDFKQELSARMARLGDTTLVITEVRQLEPETGAST